MLLSVRENVCMCRDRVAKNTENAIQLAHEDNHCAKALEVVLSNARDKGVEFCADLPLVPNLQEVKEYLSGKALGGGGGGAAAAGETASRGKGKITDTPQEGERTFFMGKSKRLGARSKDGVTVRNAIGFFMYTHCAGNAGGEWPAVLGRLRPNGLIVSTARSHAGVMNVRDAAVICYCSVMLCDVSAGPAWD
jgi:hypothetical protein